LRRLPETGKCESCGDKALLYNYNNAKTCASCLGRDARGILRTSILNKNIGKKDEQIRRARKKRW